MPTYFCWSDAVAAMGDLAGNVTDVQKSLAQVVGVALPDPLPKLVAAAKLTHILCEHIDGYPDTPLSDEFAAELRRVEPSPNAATPVPEGMRDAYAWMQYFRLLRRRDALKELALEAGDLVEATKRARDGDEGENGAERSIEEVVSISDARRIYFKGSGGAGAWPDMVRICCRRNDRSLEVTEMRRQASNNAARRTKPGSWSAAKREDLSVYVPSQPLTMQTIDRLEVIIEDAVDERPIQVHLEQHPEILGAMLRPWAQYVRPQVRLGGVYVADFLIADVSSLGIRWVLVELETPRSPVTLQNDNDLDAKTRKGVTQITDWRHWLQENISLARRRERDGGVGLYDIRPEAEGLVVGSANPC